MHVVLIYFQFQVEPPAAMGPLATSNTPSSIAGGGHVSTDCSGCGEKITDRFILQVAGSSWHGHCLRCCICHTLLDGHASCFLREEQLYCKLDYTKLFGAKCYKCARMISPADWVRKAKDQVRLNEGEGYLFLIVRKRKSIFWLLMN